MIALWNALHARFPAYRLIVSAANTPRAQQRLEILLAGVAFRPWKVFAGNIDVSAFASVVQGAALHVGPDSGGLHIARVVGTPSVSWFRPNHHIANWLPDEPGHLAFTAPESRPDGLYGLTTLQLVEAAAALLPGA
jgi:ADP-heptose:LPS heptosyltransferase